MKGLIMTTFNDDDDFEVISPDEIERVARGRKPSADAVRVAEILAPLKRGDVVVLKRLKVDLNVKNATAEKARISAVIRSGARQAGFNVRINFRPSDGAPQVEIIA